MKSLSFCCYNTPISPVVTGKLHLLCASASDVIRRKPIHIYYPQCTAQQVFYSVLEIGINNLHLRMLIDFLLSEIVFHISTEGYCAIKSVGKLQLYRVSRFKWNDAGETTTVFTSKLAYNRDRSSKKHFL